MCVFAAGKRVGERVSPRFGRIRVVSSKFFFEGVGGVLRPSYETKDFSHFPLPMEMLIQMWRVRLMSFVIGEL
jgi:hypothetical protein